MPNTSLLRSLGLFVQPGFFDPALCSQICEEMRAADFEEALVYQKGAPDGVLDESWRKALFANVAPATAAMVKERHWELKPRLEEHFQLPLSGCQGPDFLRYGDGAFFKAHKDSAKSGPSKAVKRRVSVVLFLNDRSTTSATDSYQGGALTFYGLLEGPTWEKCPFPVEPEPGLLVAFRSDILHEVQPVTFGQRFTIVSWFTSE
jgi:SM-20-related protein